MKSRNIWEMSCSLRDCLLWSSFTPQELEQIANATQFEYSVYEHLGPEDSIMIASHRMCAKPSAFTERIQQQLDQRHELAMRWLATQHSNTAFAKLRAKTACLPFPIIDLLWAAARNAQEEMRKVELVLSWRLTVEGIKAYSFGKVELIAI